MANFTMTGKTSSILTITTIAIMVMLTCQVALAESKNRSVYYKVFTELVPNENQEAIVTCDAYDDHAITEDLTQTQYDLILGVSAICGEQTDGHMDPVIHIDGFEGDIDFLKDAEDGVIDVSQAVVTCIEPLDDPEGYMGIPPQVPHRIVLECLDHDAIITETKK